MPIDFTTDDRVVLPSGLDVSGGNYTIFVWTNRTAAGSNCWFSMGNSGDNDQYIFLDSQSGTRYATRGGAGANAIAATVPTATVDVSDGNPHSIAAVRASSTSHTVYADGTNSVLDATADTAPTLDRFNLGVLGRFTEVNFLVGCIEEVYVWSTNLTAAEIELIHNAKIKGIGLGIKSANLVAYYSMDDGAAGTSADGDTVRDGSGNGNNGTGDDGPNNTGLTFVANQLLSYPGGIIVPGITAAVGSPSPSLSPSASESPSPSASESRSESASESASESRSPSVSESASESSSPSSSQSPSSSESASSSASISPSPSASESRSASVSESRSPSSSQSPSSSESASESRSESASESSSPSSSVSSSPSSSQSPSSSESSSPSVSPSPSSSFSASPSISVSLSPSASPSPSFPALRGDLDASSISGSMTASHIKGSMEVT